MIDGTTDAGERLAFAMNSSVKSEDAFGSAMIDVGPTALNQKGEMSRIDWLRSSNSRRAASRAQYGAHTSSGISGFGGGRDSLRPTKTATAATASSNAVRVPRTNHCLCLDGSCSPLGGVSSVAGDSGRSKSSEIVEVDSDEGVDDGEPGGGSEGDDMGNA